MQLVADENDRQPALRHPTQDGEQLLRLGPRQHRRRLIQDQDARIAIQRLQDLHPLPFAHRQITHPRLRVHWQAECLRQRHQFLRRPVTVRPRLSIAVPTR
jgi:hypothetical protein